MKSSETEAEWESFVKWLETANADNLTFEVQKTNKNLATALIYMKRDILENGRYSVWDEVPFLKAQGFTTSSP